VSGGDRTACPEAIDEKEAGDNWLSPTLPSGTSEKFITTQTSMTLSATRRQKMLLDERSHAYFVLGYGTNRRVESPDVAQASLRGRARLAISAVCTLFDNYLELISLAGWLPDSEKKTTPPLSRSH